ncbi:hypothetical protein BH23ACT2_BH23ACT2_19230 [soil metagenome]
MVLIVVLVVVVGRGGTSSNAGPCLGDLLDHLPEDTSLVYGTDLLQARGVGYDDGASLEDLGDTLRTTGAIADPLSRQFRFQQLTSVEELTARTGVEIADMECSLSTPDGDAVLTGTFDVDRVQGSELGADGLLQATEDRLALGRRGADVGTLVEPVEDGLGSNEAVRRVVESLRDDGSYSILVEAADTDDPDAADAGGIGVGGDDDQRELVIAYAYDDDAGANADLVEVIDQVNELARGTSSISTDDLEVDGSLIRAVIPVREALDIDRVLNGGTPILP